MAAHATTEILPCSRVSWLNVVYQFTQNCSTNSPQSQLKSQQALKKESEVAQSCLTLHNPMDYSPPGSSVHGIFQARVLEWAAIAFSDNGILLSHKNNKISFAATWMDYRLSY